MTAVIATSPKFQFSAPGVGPLINGTLTTYVAGTTTPTTTWQDRAQATANTNPIVLDGNGECLLWLDPLVTYKFVLANSEGTQQWSVDNISGATSAVEFNAFVASLAASGGSALVGFIQDGSGAVSRTAQSKMRESVSVKDFGAVGDGVTDDTAAIAACLLAAKTNGTLRVFFPVGTYNVATPIVLASYRGLTIYGEGYPVGATVGKCTYIRYTGAAGSLLTMNSCAGIVFENIWFGYNNAAYTGDLVATNNPSGLDTTNMTFVGCLFSGETLSQTGAASLLRLEKTINTQIEKCQFQYAQRGIVFYGYCNIITLRSNMFLQLVLYSTYVYSGANNTFAYYDNTFEPRISGAVAAAFSTVAGVNMQGFIFKGNWCGDVGVAGGGYWVNLNIASGVDISTNFFGTAGPGAGDYAVYLTSCSGVNISGNVFFDKAINFANLSQGVVVAGNFFPSVATQVLGRGLVSTTSSWLSNYNLTGGGLPRSKGYLPADQSVAASAHTAIVLSGNIFDQGGVHSTTVNPSRFTVPVGGAGLWQFEAAMLLASVACTYIVRITKNGGTPISVVAGLQTAATQQQVAISATDVAADGDYYEVTYWQNSGGALNVYGAAVYVVDTYMSAYKVFSGD